MQAAYGLHSFSDKVRYLTAEGLYGDYILANYSVEELEEAARFLCPERNQLLNYSGLDFLIKRYLIRTHNHQFIETVQEMFLGIALHLAMHEDKTKTRPYSRTADLLGQAIL